MAQLTLGEEVDRTLAALEQRAPDTAQLFRNELNTAILPKHNIAWRAAPSSLIGGVVPKFIGRMKAVLEALPRTSI